MTEDMISLRTTLCLSFPASDKASDKISEALQYQNSEDHTGSIIHYLSQKGDAKTAEIAKAVNLSPARTRSLLHDLCKNGDVIALGENKGRYYILGKTSHND